MARSPDLLLPHAGPEPGDHPRLPAPAELGALGESPARPGQGCMADSVLKPLPLDKKREREKDIFLF